MMNWYKLSKQNPLTTNWYKMSKKEEVVPLFRGDENPINIEEYDHNYASKVLGKELSSSMSKGPGIYFTISEKNAVFYGGNITKRNLTNANIVTESSKKFNYRQIYNILQGVDEETIIIAASNWNENHNVGKNVLTKMIASANNPIEQIMLIWSDVFSRQNPTEFVNLMSKNGIDGISIVIPNASNPSESDTHYIIYNKNVLK